MYIYIYTLLYTTSLQEGWEKKTCNMIFHFHRSGQEVKALWSCAMLRCRWMMDRNIRRLEAMVDAMDSSAVKTGCGHCNGLGFRHNSCMEHDMPEHDTWITLQIYAISIHGPWWNSIWCDLEVWKAHQFCNLCMFTNHQVSLLVPKSPAVHGCMASSPNGHHLSTCQACEQVLGTCNYIIYIDIYGLYQHVCVCHGGN